MMSNQERASLLSTQKENQSEPSPSSGQPNKMSKSSEENSNQQQMENSHTITSLHLENQEASQMNYSQQYQSKLMSQMTRLSELLEPDQYRESDKERKELLDDVERLVNNSIYLFLMRMKITFENIIIEDLPHAKKLILSEKEEGFQIFLSVALFSEIFKKIQSLSTHITAEFLNMILMVPQQYISKLSKSFHYRIGQTFSSFLNLFDEMLDDQEWFKLQVDGEINIKKESEKFMKKVNEKFCSKISEKKLSYESEIQSKIQKLLHQNFDWISEVSMTFFK